MKNLKPIAIPFKLGNSFNEKVKEFNICFDNNKNSFDKLIEFIQEYPEKRINIEFSNGVNVKILKSLCKMFDNVCARLSAKDMPMLYELKEANCKFFFGEDVLAQSYSMLMSLIHLGVSDVYIVDDLCYDLENVSNICKENNVNVRLVLNRIPSVLIDRGTDLTSPIFRPEDIDLLVKFFDIFEFDCGKNKEYDWYRFRTLYRVWFEDKKWIGQLSEINLSLDMDFPNRSIVPDFTRYKINCKRKCYKHIVKSCNKCEQFIEIGRILNKKNAAYK